MNFTIKVTYRDPLTSDGKGVGHHKFTGETWYAAFYAAEERFRPLYDDKTVLAVSVEVDES